jgi:hypothetical protein
VLLVVGGSLGGFCHGGWLLTDWAVL